MRCFLAFVLTSLSFLLNAAVAQAQTFEIPYPVISQATPQYAQAAVATSSFLSKYVPRSAQYGTGTISLQIERAVNSSYATRLGVPKNSPALLTVKANSRSLIYFVSQACVEKFSSSFIRLILDEAAKVQKSFPQTAYGDDSSDEALPKVVGYFQALETNASYSSCIQQAFQTYNSFSAILSAPPQKPALAPRTPYQY